MQKYFDEQNNRLVFSGTASSANFWDNHWKDNSLKKSKTNRDFFVSRFTRKYIAPSLEVKILEGGCGNGQFVYSLAQSGYDAYGVDYAKETVAKINAFSPELKVSVGDVFSLDFPESYFDGYWSLGVIEHFFNGYAGIAQEMKRVIKPHGYLFITFPYLSPLRRWKARRKKYALFDPEKFDPGEFYQFALDPEKVIDDFSKLGFSLVKKHPFDGMKGLKDEVSILHNLLQKVYDSQNIFVRTLKLLFSVFLAPFSGHSILLIFKKND